MPPSERWLVLDCNFLAWRAFHSTGGLQYGGTQTGAVYGFLRDIKNLMEMFGTTRVVFCWDHGEPLRNGIYPEYKANRQHKKPVKTSAEKIARAAFYSQVGKLRREYLRAIGFRNVFYERGYEADDLIATTCETIVDMGGNAIIVSGDHDFYQLLSKQVRVYHPQQKKIVTAESFTQTLGIKPSKWVQVKAMAGCETDNIKGIRGVGELTAVKYVRGRLEPGSRMHSLCTSMKKSQWDLNRRLVKIPWDDTPHFEIRDDRVTPAKWAAIADALGMKSLREWN